MIYGNASAQDLLSRFFDRIKNQGISHPFLILRGPDHVGKMTAIRQHIHQLIQPYGSDVLILEDHSIHLHKDHTIKIERPKKKEDLFIKRSDGSIYEDLGIRETQERYQKSPYGQYKIIIIEHIERMNIASANAFLKTLEEPGSKHLVIATTKSFDSIMQTIRSRAIVLSWELVGESDIQSLIQECASSLSDDMRQMIVSYSQGAPGKAFWAIHHLDDMHTRIQRAHDMRLAFIAPELVSFISQIKQLVKDGQLAEMMDFLLYQEACLTDRTSIQHQYLVDSLMLYKQYSNVPVNQEHLMLYVLLKNRHK